jgi:hypothetical protein
LATPTLISEYWHLRLPSEARGHHILL